MGARPLIILDTHIWIWANSAPHKLSASAQELFLGEKPDFGISSITIWETILLAQKGRITLTRSPMATVRVWIESNPVEILPVDFEIAVLARSLQFLHDDPTDHFIAATAFQHDARLMTADEKLLRLPWLKSIQA